MTGQELDTLLEAVVKNVKFDSNEIAVLVETIAQSRVTRDMVFNAYDLLIRESDPAPVQTMVALLFVAGKRIAEAEQLEQLLKD